MAKIKIRLTVDGELRICTDYNEDYISALKSTGLVKWDDMSNGWGFDVKDIQAVLWVASKYFESDIIKCSLPSPVKDGFVTTKKLTIKEAVDAYLNMNKQGVK